MIFYFSGTGNSRWLAQRIAFAIKDELVSLNELVGQDKEENFDIPDGRLVFVLPTYAWRIPRVVENWIRRTNFKGGEKAWFVMTCGGVIGDADYFNRALCREKGLVYMGSSPIRMPENYVALFNVPSEEEAATTIQASEPYIRRVIRKIHLGEHFGSSRWTPLRWICSHWLNPMFYFFTVKAEAFRILGDKCVGCGKCAKVCPLNNVRMENAKPVWGEKCTHCMACICNCPTQAIEYGKGSVGKRRYLMAEFVPNSSLKLSEKQSEEDKLNL